MASSEHNEDLVHGNITKQLWSVSWPMMLSIFFHTLYNIVDTYWVSKISPESIAAVSISQITLFLMISVAMGITIGSGVIMSMDIGAKNKLGAEKILGQSFVLTGIAGVFFTILSLIFRDELLTISGAAGAVFEPAKEYFTITSGGSILFFTMMTIMFAFNSQGDTFTLTKLFALSTLINLILDPLLIFGAGPIPAMGIGGAAIATLISQLIFVIIALRSLSSPKRSIQFHFRNLGFNWQSVKKVFRIGIPAALTQIINPIGLMALTLIVTYGFLEAGTVAFSLGFRIEFFAYLPAIGFGFGAMAMMAQAIGAHDLDRAKEVLKVAFRFGVLIAGGLGILAAVGAGGVIAVFTDDPLVVDYALQYLHYVPLSYAFLAMIMIEANAFQALGRSWPGFWIMFVRYALVALPISYVLTFVYEVSIIGVWLALIIGNIVAAIVGYIWIQRTLGKYTFEVVDEVVQSS